MTMSFSQASISDVRVSRDGTELFASWTSSSPWDTAFQVYMDRRLSWSGISRSCHIPYPADAVGRNVWIEVGTVEPGEETRDYSSLLIGPGGTGDRARLTWYGGTYLDPTGRDDLLGFWIFRSGVAGGAVDYQAAVGHVTAYPGSVIVDGFGMGEYGRGGFGRSASRYEWHSDPLASGTWNFAIAPYDKAGNLRGGSYGTQGYTLAGLGTQMPAYATVSTQGAETYTWADSTADPRALQRPGEADRSAATWYAGDSFTLDVALADGQAHRMSLYFVDWDGQGGGRSQKVELLDPASGSVLDSRTLSGFQGGVYLTWEVAGHVAVRLTNLNPASNAVLSGLFLDGQAAISGTMSPYLGPDATTRGSWSSSQVVSVAISAPPRPPGADSRGVRLAYTFDGPSTRQATLNWLASP